MRLLILVFSLVLGIVLAGPARSQAGARDWTATVVPQPSGAWAVGNPAARVRLVEWLSYTCSHCADFARESKAELAPRIRRGEVRVEYRTLPRDVLDLAAGLLVRCGGPSRFVGAHDAVFAAHADLMERGQRFAAAEGQPAPGADPSRALIRLAEGSGLKALMRGRGLTDAQMDRCLADRAETGRLLKIAEAAQAAGVEGTPSFDVGGRRVAAHGWTELKPHLAAR